ncbi:MAG: hypothetical protein RL071_2192 [Pseudomonadota bacterium]|jgi:uncharacterized membrane protein
MPASTQTVEIDAPIAQVWATILDFPSYPRFLPDMGGAEVRRAGPPEWEVAFELHLLRDLRYTLRLHTPAPWTLRWSLLEGAFLRNEGGWALEALSPTRTRATYEIDVQVAMYIPGNVVRTLVERSLPETLDRFRAEAERRAAAG